MTLTVGSLVVSAADRVLSEVRRFQDNEIAQVFSVPARAPAPRSTRKSGPGWPGPDAATGASKKKDKKE